MSELENNIKRLMNELGMDFESAKKAAEMNEKVSRMAQHSTSVNDGTDELLQAFCGPNVCVNCND